MATAKPFDRREYLDSPEATEAYIDELNAEIERLRAEVELWQRRWEAERADHESTIEGYKNAVAFGPDA